MSPFSITVTAKIFCNTILFQIVLWADLKVSVNVFQRFDEMEQSALTNVNNCWNIDISFYLDTSGGENSYLI